MKNDIKVFFVLYPIFFQLFYVAGFNEQWNNIRFQWREHYR